MTKVVGLGYAIDNEEATDSTKYQIKISGESAPFAPNITETYTQKQSQEGALLPARLCTEKTEPSDTNGWTGGGNVAPTIAPKIDDSMNGGLGNGDSESGGQSGGNVAPMSQTLINGHHGDSIPENGGNVTPTLNTIPSNGSSNVGGKRGTFPNKNIFKIGDRAKLGDGIFTIDRIEKDFIGGSSDDGSYLGGHIDSVKPLGADEVTPILHTPKRRIKKIPLGDRVFQIVSDETNDMSGEVEYEC